jgi:hypothetical protein
MKSESLRTSLDLYKNVDSCFIHSQYSQTGKNLNVPQHRNVYTYPYNRLLVSNKEEEADGHGQI